MLIWLVMVMLNTVAPIHVGNFNSMDVREGGPSGCSDKPEGHQCETLVYMRSGG